MKRCIPLFVLVLATLMPGCDEVNRSSFSGLIGTVGYPPIAHCDVEIYDAIEFRDLYSNAGRLTSTRTDAAGRFTVEFDEYFIGRPLVAVARPGSTARYRDFGAAGTPDVAFDAPRRPWVAIHAEWLGGEDTITINPITTMVFEAVMRLPSGEVGGGALRFDREVLNSAQAAMAANFGIRADPAQELPAPPGGPLFESVTANYLEDNDRATSYTYACLQLAKAANVFAGTTAAADQALDFYEALFRDAEDGVIDGQYFGVAEAFLNQVPALVGLDAGGASALFQWLATVPLDTTETAYAASVRGGGFDPAPSVMLGLQDGATGAVRPMRIDTIDVWNYPFSGNVEMTIRGAGMRRSDVFAFRGVDDINAVFGVDRASVGVDGQFLYHSQSELRLRIPDFAATTKSVDGALRVASGANSRRVRFELVNRPEYEKIARQVTYLLTDNARVTNRVEPLLVHAVLGRVEAGGLFLPAANACNVYPASQDPAVLVPGTDHVYELRCRVVNPSTFDINGTTLDLAATTASQLAGQVVLDQFSGALAGRALILPDTLPVEDLAPGETATLAFRFVFLDSAIPADLLAGAPVIIRPVLSGQSQGPGTPVVTTDDITDFTRTTSIAPVIADQTAVIAALSASAPATATQGDAIDFDFGLTLGSLGGSPVRDLVVDWIDIVVSFDGTTTVFRLGDSFFAAPGGAETRLTTFTSTTTGGRALPLTLNAINPAGTLRLTIQTAPGHTGSLTVNATASARDAATGYRSTAGAMAATTVMP